MSKHYDVAVLGGGIGALTAAALLSRRSWRVLVLGHGWRPATYQHDGLTLARRTFAFLAGSSPVWSRVLVELAQSQAFCRRTYALDPMFQFLAPGLRLEAAPDLGTFGKEIDRSFPEVRRVIDNLYVELARSNAAADATFEKDLVMPPGTFWERREVERALVAVPQLDPTGSSLLAELPQDHPYRAVVTSTARFAGSAQALPELAAARLHGAWTRGVLGLRGGEAELVDFLVERIRAQGGDVDLDAAAARVAQRRGRATGVVIDGDDEITGAEFVVTDRAAGSLLDLAIGYEPPRRALLALPRLRPTERRFVLSIVVRDEGLPNLLCENAFVLPEWPRHGRAPAGPSIFLQRRPCGVNGASLLIAEAAMTDPESPPAPRARETVLGVLQSFLPYVERHYLMIDSPHDGRPLWDFRSGARRDVSRGALRSTGGSLGPEPMTARWRVDPAAFHGLAADAVRAPLDGAFVVGPSVLPALGQEGELLAAWSAARLVTRTDRRRERMRREMWNKIELR